MKESRVLPEALSIDSGVILAFLLGEELGETVRSEILSRNGRRVYCNRLAVSELFYILCRRRGERFAREATEALLKSGRLSLVSSDELDIQAGVYKCARGISLVDCYVLAAAKVLDCAATFARREDDLKREMTKAPFDLEIIFLEDLVKRKRAN